MIRFLIGLLVFVVWTGLARRYYVCTIKGECEPPAPEVDSSFLDNLPRTLDLTAGTEVLLNDYPQFYFDYASHAYTYVDGNEKFLGLVATFLREHPDPTIRLEVTGYHTQEEIDAVANSNLYNNLGLARAQTIIDKLIEEYNVPASRLSARSALTDHNPVTTPLSFEILGYIVGADIATAADTALLEQIKVSVKDITYDSKGAKFDYNSGEFKPSGSFDVYVDSLQQYFVRNPEDFLLIIGHTDSKGGDNYNQQLGLRRARSVKAYLQARNIDIPIKTQSKGEQDPLVMDHDEEGRYDTEAMAKNRRVNILVREANSNIQERN
ncbi:MAG: OmpA family protein [Aureispira sp.]